MPRFGVLKCRLAPIHQPSLDFQSELYTRRVSKKRLGRGAGFSVTMTIVLTDGVRNKSTAPKRLTGQISQL